jgi:hypothetical protein
VAEQRYRVVLTLIGQLLEESGGLLVGVEVEP